MIFFLPRFHGPGPTFKELLIIYLAFTILLAPGSVMYFCNKLDCDYWEYGVYWPDVWTIMSGGFLIGINIFAVLGLLIYGLSKIIK